MSTSELTHVATIEADLNGSKLTARIYGTSSEDATEQAERFIAANEAGLIDCSLTVQTKDWPYPHLGEGEWSRGRLIRELQEAGWWAVAEDVADGLHLDAVLDRLHAMGESESVAADLISSANV